MTSNQLTLAHVLLYRSMGLTVIPVKRGGKEPLVKWGGYEYSPPTQREYDEWIRKYWMGPEPANISIITGAVSGNLVVVDFDNLEVYYKTFKAEEIEKETIVVATGRGGRHVWFTTPTPIPSFKIPQLRIDVKSNGGYVVAPNSIHPSGRRYVFVNDTRKILEAPDITEALLKKAEKLGAGRIEVNTFKTSVKYPWRRHPPCIRKLLEGVPQGMRHDATVRLASYFINSRGMEVDEVIEMLLKWNMKNTPPLDEKEVKANIISVAKHGYIFGCRGLSPFYCEREKCPFTTRQTINMRKLIENIKGQTEYMEPRTFKDLIITVRSDA